jgi:hypothetical protein
LARHCNLSVLVLLPLNSPLNNPERHLHNNKAAAASWVVWAIYLAV